MKKCNEFGFTDKYLESLWDKDVWMKFCKFMYGQTGMIDEEGYFISYFDDVEHFCRINNIPFPETD